MAKISSELKQILINLEEMLLNIVDEAKTAEFSLMKRFGETNETIVV